MEPVEEEATDRVPAGEGHSIDLLTDRRGRHQAHADAGVVDDPHPFATEQLRQSLVIG